MTRIFAVFIVAALAACSKSAPAAASGQAAQDSTPAAAPAAPAPPKPVPAELPEIVARVNGETISRSDLETAIGEVEARAGQPMPAGQRDQVIRAVLDQLIGYRLLAQESAARKMTVADADLETRMGQIRSQFPSEEAFQQAMQQRQTTLDKLRNETRSSMQITAMLQAELDAKAAVTAGQVKDFYDKNPDKFQQGERVKASHILVRVQANADAAEREQARTKATGILADVKAGRDFAALAKQHSDDPGSGANGGDLGYFERGQMVPPFEQSAFTLTPGQVSDLVQSDFGYHIIKVIDRQSGRMVPLEEVRPRIEQYLLGVNREEQTRLFVEALKSKGTVEILI